MKKILILLVVLIAGVVFLFLKVPYLRTVFKKTTPVISISDLQSTSGAPSISVSVTDEGVFDKLSVSISQGEKRKSLLENEFNPPESSKSVTVQLPSVADGFADGKATVTVEALDAGFWANKGSTSKEILLDSRPPRVEVISQQHVVAQGGSELVLLRAKDENLTGVGVTVGSLSFPAFPLSNFDQFFVAHPDLYGVLFALPLEFDADRGKVEAFATDAAGNRRGVALNFRIARAKEVNVNPKLTLDFLKRKLPDLLVSYAQMARVQVPNETQIQDAAPDELIKNFKLVNETYRALLQDKLKEMLSGTISPRQWGSEFMKPMSSATTSIFGERRSYSLDGVDAGKSIHYGLDLASVYNDSVKASNSGVVLFAGEFGIYGEAVIVDHGLGLTSLYGHLSSLSVAKGDTVQRGQEVGRSGQTGLAGGDHLHFEYRLNNVPVTPIEWWDPKWVVDHVTGKLGGLRNSFIDPAAAVPAAG